jgi:hypothetical protein
LSQDDVPEQLVSAGNWQMVVSLVFTQLCPVGQSAEVWQASWHLPMVHTNVPLQSLLRMHVPPTSILLGELQPIASDAEIIIKPRTRDTDISSLQFGFRLREDCAL